MVKVSQAAKVGIFVLVSAGASFGIWRLVGKEVGGSGHSYTVHAYFDDVTGLATRTRVTIAGIPVGSIAAIKLEGTRARVDIKMSGDVPLHEDAAIGKKAPLVFGEPSLILAAGTDGRPNLKDGDEITHRIDFVSTEQLADQLHDIASQVKEVTTQLAKSVGSDEGGRNMQRILANLADATEALNATIRENRVLINDTLKNVNAIAANGAPQLDKILENVRVISEDIRSVSAQAAGKGGANGEVREMVEHLTAASKSLESALSHIDSVSGRVDRGEGTIGRLSKDETLVNEVQSVAEGVNDYVSNLTRLQTIVGLRSDYNFLANTIKSYVELRIQPREDKYYMIELINDPRGKTSFTQTDVDTTNPNDPAHYRTITTTTTDAFRFSLMFARRLGPFTGRFGLKESTGGIGLDTHLLQDRFELAQDLFGFGEEIQPRYRVWIGYEFIHRLWLLGGVDYIFSPNKRDYFLGLQLRFNDEDLKTILPFAGGAAGAAK